MRRVKRQVRRGRVNKSRPRLASHGSCPALDASSPPSPPDFIFLPNAHDQFAIAKLRSASIGELAVDRLVRNDPKLMRQLREALVQVYFNAAHIREFRKATKPQFDHARSAAGHLADAMKHLETAAGDGKDVLSQLLLGPPLDDAKSDRETNWFGARCLEIRLSIAPSWQALQFAIDAETEKFGKGGERAKRLRTLVDALAAW